MVLQPIWWISTGLLLGAAGVIYWRTSPSPLSLAASFAGWMAFWTVLYDCWFSAGIWLCESSQVKRRRIIILTRGSSRRGWDVELDRKPIAMLRSPFTPDQFWTEYRITPLVDDAKQIEFWHQRWQSMVFRNRLTGRQQCEVIPRPHLSHDKRGNLILAFRGFSCEVEYPTICERIVRWRREARARRLAMKYLQEHAHELIGDEQIVS
jgi:hypothetical protein